jgi:tetratricopeptide (TPR) repeat protein
MEETKLLQTLRELQRTHNIKEALQIVFKNPGIEFSENQELRIIYAIIQCLSGNLAKAVEILPTINPDELKDEEALADYGLLLFLTGSDKAEEYLKKALAINPDCFIANARISAIYIANARYEEAEKYLSKALEIEPERVELIANLASLRARQGRFEEALSILNEALAKNSDRHELLGIKTNIMLALDKIDEVIEEYYEKIRNDPENKFYYINLSTILINAGREDEAVSLISGALDKFEEDEYVKSAFIQITLKAQRHYLLGSKLKEWVEKEPESTELRFLLNQARIECGFLDAAEEDLEKFPEELKYEPQWKMLKAKLLVEKNRADEAIKLLEEVVEQFPGHIEARKELAHILMSVGRKEEANFHLEAVESLSPSVLIKAIRYSDYDAEEEEIERLKAIMDNVALPVEQRISAGFTLAEIYEKRKEYDKSFEIVIKANELTKTIVRYDWKEHRRYVQRIMANFNKETIKRLEGKGHPSRRPIFITGMPRSGTTLVEQILASHSMVYGAGELPWINRITMLFPKTNGGYPYPDGINYMDERHLISAGEYYLEKLNLYNKDAPFVTDKLPHNFDHIGLIYLIFPNAVIIHLKRDPRDVAVSNYYQNYAAMRGLMGFANDLKDIGHMLNDHERIMKHWHEVLPEGKIFEVVYEELVEDPERVIKELLHYIGLPWEDNVMKFYETQRPVKTASIHQVRKGIYKESKERWRRYEKYLTPLFEVLEEGFVPID